ncbi:MAG TPA: FkbM family methyltransferase [Polyangiales bacterium]|nr:FkbM family methyltransferase [Polyangiales bacterium]
MHLAPLQTIRFLFQHPLSSQKPIDAVVRYMRWQLGSRLSPGPIVVDFAEDARLLVRPGMTGATGNVYAGLHEYEDMAFVLHVLRPGDLFVDVGANVGSYTVLAAKVAGARVVAFEPIASTFQALADNIALNAISDRVEARRECVGRSSGVVKMSANLDTVNHVLTEQAPDATSIEVPLVSLDEALTEAPFLIKLDVEGYELEALHGAKRVLADPALQALVVEINLSGDRYGRSDAEVFRLIEQQGFQLYDYDPKQRTLVPGDLHRKRANHLYVRDAARVQERLRTAKKIRVQGQQI